MNSNSLERLYNRMSKLYPGQDLVFGDGKPDAGLMLVGEAPGRDEVVQKKPFVGKAGQNLEGFLETLGLSRAELFVTNVCKFRPTRTSAKNTVSNRPPTKEEIIVARPLLCEEIELVAPKLLVTLGNTPLHAVKDFNSNIGEHHGKPERISIGNRAYWLFALYHPASILYNPSLKETYARDLSGLAAWLDKNM